MTMAVDPQRETRTCRCDACGNQMKLLADMPPTVRYQAVRVFRCARCNTIKSEREGPPALTRA
jgi:hypothetical protein